MREGREQGVDLLIHVAGNVGRARGLYNWVRDILEVIFALECWQG